MSFVGGKAPFQVHKAARRILAREGLAALMPKFAPRDTDIGHRHYLSPKISKRVASVLRKEAIRNGTYGTFNKETLNGWERSWDIQLELAKHGEGRRRIRAPKGRKRERNREQRAQKIDKALAEMDQRIDEFRAEQAASKPFKGIEWKFKRMLRGKKK